MTVYVSPETQRELEKIVAIEAQGLASKSEIALMVDKLVVKTLAAQKRSKEFGDRLRTFMPRQSIRVKSAVGKQSDWLLLRAMNQELTDLEQQTRTNRTHVVFNGWQYDFPSEAEMRRSPLANQFMALKARRDSLTRWMAKWGIIEHG
jgi:hypothetical protein